MSELIVYSVPGSPFGRAVLITLEEKAAAYRLVPVPPHTLRSAEHLSRHPFGRVPVLEHGDFRLCETQAILRYLDRVLPQPSLTPADARTAARMDQLMNVNDWYVFQGVANVIAFQRIVAPRITGRAPDEAAIAAALPRAHHVFDALAGLLGNESYFAGADLTRADLYWASFFEANLTDAILRKADLRGADLKKAMLVRADLSNAKLGRDNLGGPTHLEGANLEGAILDGAVLTGARYDDATIFPAGFSPVAAGMKLVEAV